MGFVRENMTKHDGRQIADLGTHDSWGIPADAAEEHQSSQG
jgi:hypothetical protein